MSNVLVIGGGAAGMYAAATAASLGHSVVLAEKNEKLGKKVFITGKGRCNVTNATPDPEQFFANIVSNPKFMFSSYHKHTNTDFLDVMEQYGFRYKIERGERVFPVSDRAVDVIQTLKKMMDTFGVKVRLNTTVKELILDENGSRCIGAVAAGDDGKKFRLQADAVIVATGGVSYPSTGSTGDGYRFAGKAGITVIDPKPALVPMNVKEADLCRFMMGLSLKNVSLRMMEEKKVLYEGFGEMLFTHFGISGPLVLSASGYVPAKSAENVRLFIDLKPALSAEVLENRITRELEEGKNKEIQNIFPSLYPSKMVPVMLKLCGLEDTGRKANSITREEKKKIVEMTKNFPLTFASLRGFPEAIITRGGVSVKEINPSTMESKKVKGLYFAGEVLDVDALTGGFNLQIAWSSAYAAANAVEWV